MGSHWEQDFFCGGTENPLDLEDLGASCSGGLWEDVYGPRQLDMGNL